VSNQLETSFLSKSRVLVVDDDVFYQNFICQNLLTAGIIEIETANNGKDALEKTISFQPDLVILDLAMPVMDGFTYCENIRKDPIFANMPILVQTGMSNSAERMRAFAVGATDMILKPVDNLELIARTKVHLERKKIFDGMQTFQVRVQEELILARDLQLGLMPSPQRIETLQQKFNLTLNSHFEPCSEIGGDAWDARALSTHELAIFSCDFAGHGISSALNVFRFYNFMQDIISEASNPALYLQRINQKMYEILPCGQFSTMFMAVIDVSRNLLWYAGAGSPQPLLFSAEKQECSFLNSAGSPLGAIKNPNYQLKFTEFNHGDKLFIYSDALLENHKNQYIDEEKYIKESMTNHFCNHKSTNEFIDKMTKHAHKNGKIMDDLTMVLCGRDEI